MDGYVEKYHLILFDSDCDYKKKIRSPNINEVNNMSINRNASMRPETNPAGNLLQEISEAELNQLSAGAGEPRASWGDFCTSTLECTFGTMICCPPET